MENIYFLALLLFRPTCTRNMYLYQLRPSTINITGVSVIFIFRNMYVHKWIYLSIPTYRCIILYINISFKGVIWVGRQGNRQQMVPSSNMGYRHLCQSTSWGKNQVTITSPLPSSLPLIFGYDITAMAMDEGTSGWPGVAHFRGGGGALKWASDICATSWGKNQLTIKYIPPLFLINFNGSKLSK